MIHELDSIHYHQVRPLFDPLSHHSMVSTVLSGSHAGRVFVDHPAAPRTAFLTLWGSWCFLAGRSDCDGFNRALNRTVYARDAVPRREPWLIFTCHPEGWGGRLAEVFPPAYSSPPGGGTTWRADWTTPGARFCLPDVLWSA